MPRRKALTDIGIRHLKVGSARREVPDPGQRGLYVVVQSTGRKGFAVRYRFHGKPKKMTLQAGLTLAQARKLAGDALYSVAQGIDPANAQKAAKAKAAEAAADTVEAICREYLAREGRRLRSASERATIFERLVYPKLGHQPILEVKKSDIVRLLDAIEDKNGPVAADKVLAVLRRVMTWHASRSDEFRSPIVRGMARTKPKERARSRTLSDEELRAVWIAAESAQGPFPALIRFLLLTAARRDEAADLPWSEIEPNWDWVLPADRHKTGKVIGDLVRPLSRAAQDLLTGLPKIGDGNFVFTTGSGEVPISGFSKFKTRFDRMSGVRGWQLRDLRRTARSVMSRTGVPSDHAERVLGHVIPGIRGTYDRHEYRAEKAQAMDALAAQIERIVRPPADNVVQLANPHK